MAYFVDLSEYSYSHRHWRVGTFNVGWLDHAHSFESGETPDDIVGLLWKICKSSIAQARGSYSCNHPGCIASRKDSGPMEVAWSGTVLRLGSAEIRVFGNDGSIYAAPNLIFHYVTAHQYKLPARFIEALRSGPDPESPEYERRLVELCLKRTRTLGI